MLTETWKCPACGREYTVAMGRTDVCRCKEPKEPQPMRGLGDLVERGLRAVGIKKTVDCGCSKRQAWLNKIVPF